MHTQVIGIIIRAVMMKSGGSLGGLGKIRYIAEWNVDAKWMVTAMSCAKYCWRSYLQLMHCHTFDWCLQVRIGNTSACKGLKGSLWWAQPLSFSLSTSLFVCASFFGFRYCSVSGPFIFCAVWIDCSLNKYSPSLRIVEDLPYESTFWRPTQLPKLDRIYRDIINQFGTNCEQELI